MKRFLLASLTLAFFAAPSFAQTTYQDDVYYSGSQAQKDAQLQKQAQKNANQNNNSYNSSGDNYYGENDGQNQIQNGYDYQDNYIDYDDDSYTTRIRRFYYPIPQVGYWGSVYSPYWMDPFYANPYYNGWYSPGISFSFGFGNGPYWNNYWGMNTWYGYGGFSSWYNPYSFYGYGFGSYYMGYWNGYYSGMYDGGYLNNNYTRTLNYGPRGSRGDLRSSGSYGRDSRTSPINQGMVTPQRGTVNENGLRQSTREIRQNNNVIRENTNEIQQRENFQRDGSQRQQQSIDRNQQPIRIDNSRNLENNRNIQPQTVPQNNVEPKRGLFNRSRSTPTVTPQQSPNSQRTAPTRTYEAPSRNYSQPSRSITPSRSYSPSSGGSRNSGTIRR